MRYIMKQKLFAWGDDFIIKDENEKESFFVDGKVFCLGNQLSFQDMSGNELAFIKQKLLAFSATYELYRDNELYAMIKKDFFSFFKCRFTIDIPGPDDLEAEGNFLDHEYTFTRHGKTVARVSKQWFAWTDTYGVDIKKDEDDILILASTVVIDMACHEHKKKSIINFG